VLSNVSANIAVAIFRVNMYSSVSCRQPYIGQEVGGALGAVKLICGAKKRAAIQPIHNHPEDSNCDVYRNVGELSLFDMAHARKPEILH